MPKRSGIPGIPTSLDEIHPKGLASFSGRATIVECVVVTGTNEEDATLMRDCLLDTSGLTDRVLMEYVSDELSAELEARVRNHLQRCPMCWDRVPAYPSQMDED